MPNKNISTLTSQNTRTTTKSRRFIEKIDSPHTTGPVHYIPRHHFSKDSKTMPIRIVYDCSCKPCGNHPSPNDCLEIGPFLVNDLCFILLRFCVHKSQMLSTDIEEAFYMLNSIPRTKTLLIFYGCQIQKILRVS